MNDERDYLKKGVKFIPKPQWEALYPKFLESLHAKGKAQNMRLDIQVTLQDQGGIVRWSEYIPRIECVVCHKPINKNSMVTEVEELAEIPLDYQTGMKVMTTFVGYKHIQCQGEIFDARMLPAGV